MIIFLFSPFAAFPIDGPHGKMIKASITITSLVKLQPPTEMLKQRLLLPY